MFKSLIRKAFGREFPLVAAPSDFISRRARTIANEKFLRISDLPELYFELEKTDELMEIDTSEFIGDRPPAQYNQVLAGAVLNYELTQRRGFKILINERTYELFGGIVLDGKLFGEIHRKAPIGVHERMANEYIKIAEKIYDVFELANRLIK